MPTYEQTEFVKASGCVHYGRPVTFHVDITIDWQIGENEHWISKTRMPVAIEWAELRETSVSRITDWAYFDLATTWSALFDRIVEQGRIDKDGFGRVDGVVRHFIKVEFYDVQGKPVDVKQLDRQMVLARLVKR